MKFVVVSLILALNFNVITIVSSEDIDYSSEELFHKWLPYLPKAITITSVLYSVRNKIANMKHTQCFEDINLILLGLRNNEEWALKMFDASAKIANGKDIFQGNLIWFGSPSICDNITSPHFETHFCRLNINKATALLQINLCVPQSCQEKYFNEIAMFLSEIELPIEINIDLLKGPLFEVICTDEKSPTALFEGFNKFGILCFCLIGIVIFATIFEILRTLKNFEKKDDKSVSLSKMKQFQAIEDGEINKNYDELVSYAVPKERSNNEFNIVEFVLCFSALKNGRKLINMKKKNNHISCLDGIRSLAFFSVVYGHLIMGTASFADNPIRLLELLPKNTYTAIFFNGFTFSVDTFFVLSGFCGTHSLLKKSCKQKKIWRDHVFHRYLRISPVFYFSFLFYVFVFNNLKLKNGIAIAESRRECNNVILWPFFLYIENFFKQSGCFAVAWYLYNDMQFHLLLPCFIIIIKKLKFKSLLVFIGCIMTSMLIVVVILYNKKLNLSFAHAKESFSKGFEINADDYHYSIYIKPYCRIPPFIMGVLCAWLYSKTKDKIKFTKLTVMLLFSLSFLCFYTVVFADYHLQFTFVPWMVFESLRITLWSLALCIVIFLCCSNHGGIINSFLSWRGWSIFSQLSYSSYLVHVITMLYISQEFFIGNHFQLIEAFRTFFNLLPCVVVLGGLSLHLIVEAPATNLQNMFWKKEE